MLFNKQIAEFISQIQHIYKSGFFLLKLGIKQKQLQIHLL